MRVREKNPALKKVIEDFSRKGHEKGIWKALAEGLNRPRSRRYEMDISRLERFAKAGETVVVPGVVLGRGGLTKPVNVAAVKFSASARQKIERAGGRCIDIAELDGMAVSKATIMG